MSTTRTDSDTPQYRGRFAPSPTGPLHAGSLVAALASFLDARHQGGSWALRIDDLDPPRQVDGSIELITAALQAHGLEWDGPMTYQSLESDRYEHALSQLEQSGWLFRCRCTRATLSAQGACGQGCADRELAADEPHSLRVRFDGEHPHEFDDRFLGPQVLDSEAIPCDFIVKRRDGLYAYQLAAAVGDAQPQFNTIVRGADLLESTYRQRWLQHVLGLEPPHYAHVPVVSDGRGNKLSKQTGAAALNMAFAEQNLRGALSHLDQAPPPESVRSASDILEHAIEHWSFPSGA